MILDEYSLIIDKRILLENVCVSFSRGKINHILGNNGVGKSCFAKSLLGLFKYSGRISILDKPVIIGSYSNVPLELTLNDLVKYYKKMYDEKKIFHLMKLMNIDNSINPRTHLKSLSDGQKQKIKLLSFLIDDPDFIILDEFTTSLDKKSTLEIYKFLKAYVEERNVLCLNITHNLSDIEYMPGTYYYFGERKIINIASKEEMLQLYVKGGIL